MQGISFSAASGPHPPPQISATARHSLPSLRPAVHHQRAALTCSCGMFLNGCCPMSSSNVTRPRAHTSEARVSTPSFSRSGEAWLSVP